MRVFRVLGRASRLKNACFCSFLHDVCLFLLGGDIEFFEFTRLKPLLMDVWMDFAWWCCVLETFREHSFVGFERCSMGAFFILMSCH